MTEQKALPPTVLLVDDDEDVQAIVVHAVSQLGYFTVTATNGAEGRDIILSRPIDIVVSDLVMPKMSGMALLKAIRDAGQQQPFIFVTAYASPESVAQAKQLGAFGVVEKPFNPQEFGKVLNAAAASLKPKS